MLVLVVLHVRQKRHKRSFDRECGVFKPFLLSRAGYTSLEGGSSTDFAYHGSERNRADSHGRFCSFPGSRSPGAQQHEKSRSNMSSSSDSGSSVGRAPDRSRFHARINSLGVECQSLPDVEEGRVRLPITILSALWILTVDQETGHTRPPMRVTNLSQGCKSEESTYLHIMSPSRTHRAASHHQHRIRRPSDASPACEFSMSPVCNTIEEDYAHLIVEGEPSPPDYWQATRKHRRVVG